MRTKLTIDLQHFYRHLRSQKINYEVLKEYNRRWYIFGAAEEDEKLLSFSLDRIDGIKPLASHKYIEYRGDVNEIFEDIIGVTLYEDSPIYQIYFWVSDLSKDYVATKPLHESQKQIGGIKDLEFRNTYAWLNGGQIFRIDCKYNYELIRELCSFGNDLLVLSPIEIQNKVKCRIDNMAHDYQKLQTAIP